MRQALPKAWKPGKTNTVPSPWYFLQDASVFFFLGWEWHAMTVCLSEIQCFIARACWLKHCDCQGATKWVRATFSPPDQCFELFWASNNQYNIINGIWRYMYVNATFVCMGHMCIIVYICICLFHVWLIHLPNTKASPKFEKKNNKNQPSNAGRFPQCGSLQLPNLRAPPWYWHYNRYLPCQVDPARSPRSLFCTKVVPTWKLLTTRWMIMATLTWMVPRMSFHVILMATNEKTCVVHQLSRNYYRHSRIAPYV